MSSELNAKPNKERALLVTIPLLILHLALLSLQIENPSGTLVFKSWVLAAQAPVLALSTSVTNGIRQLWTGYVWLVGARRENRELQQTVQRLSMLNRSYEQVRQENARLRRLLALNESIAYDTIGARVIARTPGFLANVIYIDRGSRDGVQPDAPVLCGDGIVGRTVLVFRNQSQVQLITNPDASVGVMLERTRTPGVLRGSGQPLLDLVYVSNTEDVVEGDVVLSSDWTECSPRDLFSGRLLSHVRVIRCFGKSKCSPA